MAVPIDTLWCFTPVMVVVVVFTSVLFLPSCVCSFVSTTTQKVKGWFCQAGRIWTREEL